MPRLQRVFTLTIFFVSFSLFANTSSESPSQESIAQTADNVASQYHDMGWFSGNVLLAKDGKVFFSKSYGFANSGAGVKNTKDTRFNLGSIMKDFTKVLLLQQVEQGKLELSDTLASFELGFPKETASKITVKHLMDHRSGLEDIFIAKYRENQLAFDTLNKKLELLKHAPLRFEPGSDFHYSNYGYVVLGAILEKVTKQSFEQLLKQNILKPTGLESSHFAPDPSDPKRSISYSYYYDGTLNKVGITEHPGPDGGIEATDSDVQKFYRALFYTNKLLDTEQPLIRQTFAMNGEHWGAYGGGTGVSAAVEVDLKNGIEIVVLANSDQLIAERISGRILSFIKSSEFQPIRDHVSNFTYDFYQRNGKDSFYQNFKTAYETSGYHQFIGRTINELGMQMLTEQKWREGFDMFNYLVVLFPEAPQAYDSLAYAWHAKGEVKQAKATFRKALALRADFQSDYSSGNYGVGE